VFRQISAALALVMVVLNAPALVGQGPQRGDPQRPDTFQYMSQQNKASIVMLAEKGLVPRPVASTIASGIRQVIADEAKPGAQRSGDYLRFEALLEAAVGADASRLHTGRSRQDLGSTNDRMSQRDALLEVFSALTASREKLLKLAGEHVNTVIPAYTHGVQAQPTSLAHYLLAYAASLDRSADRLTAAYGRINLSPLGAAALATSGFPLDRARLATLLGFDGLVENSYDANHVSPVDIKTEFAAAISTSAIMVGQFVEDLHIQYHDPAPWIQIKEGPLTGISSIMPQKRNPSVLERLRGLSSQVVGDSHTVVLMAHNTSTGMSDYRGPQQVVQAAQRAAQMFDIFGQLVDALVINPKRALKEVDDDYATMTEVADTLQRIADVPFRIGHHFASELTTYGRERGKRPRDLTWAELQQIYKDASHGQTMPLTETQMRQTLDAAFVVANRHGLGGSQPDEVKRMLDGGRARVAASAEWLRTQKAALQRAELTLDQEFANLIGR